MAAGAEGEGENKDDEEEDKGHGGKEKSAARFSISFSSEKETVDPRPLHLLSLGDVRVDRICSNKQTQTSWQKTHLL